MSKTILIPTASADNSNKITINDNDILPISISAPGLGSGEYCTLQYSPDNINWYDFYADEVPTPVRITPNNSMISIWAPGIWRVTKSVTVTSVGAYLHTRSNP